MKKILFSLAVLFMAAVNAFITIALNFCSIRSLSYVNLSVYAVFITMDGMLVPSLYGVLFLHEPVTAGKIIGTVLVIGAMVCGVEKRRAPEQITLRCPCYIFRCRP